jgi:hypothetical protein
VEEFFEIAHRHFKSIRNGYLNIRASYITAASELFI